MKFSRRLGKGSERSKGFLLVQPPRRNTPETVETLCAILRNTNMNMHRRQRPDLVDDWDVVVDPRPAFGAERHISAEAAEALGVPVGTIMSRLSRARDRVRAHLRAHTSSFGRTP
jgi:hypothetical protein